MGCPLFFYGIKGVNVVRVAGVDASTKMSGVAIMSDGVVERYLLIDLHKEKDAMNRIKLMMMKIWIDLSRASKKEELSLLLP